MKTLYVHIGTPKTATTTLQEMCMKNQAALHAQGYSYPSSPFHYKRISDNRNGHFLVGERRSMTAPEEYIKKYNEDVKVGLLRVHEEFEHYDNVILSDENLWKFVHYLHSKPLDILMDDAKNFGYVVKVLVYLRRQDGYILSNWNQVTKKFALSDTAEEYVTKTATTRPLALDYAASLDIIASVIGKENVIVRRFEPSAWVGGDICLDFLDAVGLDPEGFKFPESEKNLRLENNYIEIIRLINATPTLEMKEKIAFTNCAREASATFGGDYKYSMFSVKETEDLLTKFRSGNERVATEYIGDGRPMFTDEIKNLPKYSTNNDYMAVDLIHFFAQVDLMIMRDNEALRQDIKALSETVAGAEKALKKQQKAIDSVKKENQKTREMIRHPFRTVLRFIKKKFRRKGDK